MSKLYHIPNRSLYYAATYCGLSTAERKLAYDTKTQSDMKAEGRLCRKCQQCQFASDKRSQFTK
jgi:hypothetical protein